MFAQFKISKPKFGFDLGKKKKLIQKIWYISKTKLHIISHMEINYN